MSRQNVIFQGTAQLYLQGLDALQVAEPINGHGALYYLGAPISRITIRDFRMAPVKAAEQALQGRDIFDFAKIFNSSADVEIITIREEIKIQLFDTKEKSRDTVLLMGVITDDWMPIYPSFYEEFRLLEDDRKAFVSLIETQALAT